MRGRGEQRQFWGTGKIGNHDFEFGEQGNKTIYFRWTREEVPSGRASILMRMMFGNQCAKPDVLFEQFESTFYLFLFLVRVWILFIYRIFTF